MTHPVVVEQVKYMLMAADMDGGVAFYRDAFGLVPRFVSPHWSELAWKDAVVALHGGGDGSPNRTGLSFQVEDADAACQAVAALGGRVVKGPESRPGEPIRLAHAVDPEGNEFMITQYVGH